MSKPSKVSPMPWTVTKSPDCIDVRMDVQAGFEQWFMLSGDRHQDNPDCRRDIEERHLKQAVERKAGIIDVGDFFCVMGGKYDRRSDKSKLRPEHQRSDYLDALVEEAAERYAPYAHNFIVIGDGNHETSIKERHEVDLIERTVGLLNARTGSRIHHGGYTGWVRFLFNRGSQRLSRKLWYMHGYGGGGPVTMDTIQAQRQRTYIENADVMLTGHTHDSWAVETCKIRLNDGGCVERRPVWQVKTASYKDEYREGRGGWHVQTGKPPKPIGCYWLVFRAVCNHSKAGIEMVVQKSD